MDLSALNRHSRRWSLAYVLQLVGMFGVLFAVQTQVNADIIIDDFENQDVKSGIGTPVGYFSFGNQLSDRGVSTTLGSVSGSKSAFYVIDFSLEIDTFGVGAAREGLNLSLTHEQAMSVSIRVLNTSVVGTTPFVAFRLEDSDGTVFRTSNTNLFAVGTGFTRISQSITALTHQDFVGSTAGLDLTQIRSVGLLFFDRTFSGTATVVFDDLAITAVPEPNQVLALTLCSALAGVYRLSRGLLKRKTKTGL